MNSDSKALVLMSKDARSMPETAVLEVSLTGEECFYAGGMQSHNGFTVFTDVRLKTLVTSSWGPSARIHSDGDVKQTKKGTFFCTDTGFRDSQGHYYTRPLLTRKTETIKYVNGLESMDHMDTWAKTTREEAIAQADEIQKKSNEETLVKNSTYFPESVDTFVYRSYRNKHRDLPWYKRMFDNWEKKYDTSTRNRDKFYLECAKELYTNRHEVDVKFDLEVLKDQGFDVKELGWDTP